MGDAHEIAMTRTLLPFYLPMRKPEDALNALAMMNGTNAGHLKFRLGILTSRFRSNHPLKACMQCMQNDLAKYGIAYWHLSHQFPGVWVCTEHAELLVQSTTKSTGVGRFQWTLPDKDDLVSVTADDETVCASIDMPALLRFSCLAKALGHLSAGTHFDATQLAKTYRYALFERGLLTPAGQLKLGQLSADYVASVSSLQVIPEFFGLASHALEANGGLGRWLRTPRGGTHPLRHLSIIYWLFYNWDTFMDRYSQSAHLDLAVEARQPFVKETDDPRVSQAISLIEQGKSYSQIAKSMGIDVQTAIAWAVKAGYQTSRRPKILKPAVLPELIAALKTGLDKATAAEKFSISVTTVTRILRSEVGLQNAWHEARRSRSQEQAKSSWIAATSEFAHLGIKALRNLEPAAYAWLYRNDREWLTVACDSLRLPPRRSTLQRVDWHSRDLSLSAAVIRTAANIAAIEKITQVPLWRIYQVLPELKAKLSALKRLPLTAAAIKDVTGRHQQDDINGNLF